MLLHTKYLLWSNCLEQKVAILHNSKIQVVSRKKNKEKFYGKDQIISLKRPMAFAMVSESPVAKRLFGF